MGKTRVIKVEQTKEDFKDKVSDLLEEMWEKIGRYHHGVSGHAPRDYVAPDADLSESENVLTYQLDLPGMDEGDVEVLIEGGRLIIRGERQDERKESGKNYIFSERRYGRFERSFVLPGDVDQERVRAGFEKGVLTITVPCTSGGDAKPRKIEVRHG